MPFIEVRAFEERFADDDKAQLLIERLTGAFASVYGEDVGAQTEVVLVGVPRERWGFGGERRLP